MSEFLKFSWVICPTFLPYENIFFIGILPDNQPTFITPYRMSPSELKELKDQLRDLLGKGFIFPSIPHLGYSVVVC